MTLDELKQQQAKLQLNANDLRDRIQSTTDKARYLNELNRQMMDSRKAVVSELAGVSGQIRALEEEENRKSLEEANKKLHEAKT